MRPSIASLSFVGLFLGLADIASAQTLAGEILHLETKRPAAGALVSLFDDSTRVAASIRADSATGMFYLDAPHPGRYRVVINLPNGAAYLAGVERFDSTETHERVYSLPPLVVPTKDTTGLYFATEVDSIAFPLGHRAMPSFNAVRWRGAKPAEATITFVIVIDSAGRPEMDSFQTLATSDAGFADAVRQEMRHWRFTPAWKNGHHVRMIWQSGVTMMALGITRQIQPPPSPIGTARAKLRPGEPVPTVQPDP